MRTTWLAVWSRTVVIVTAAGCSTAPALAEHGAAALVPTCDGFLTLASDDMDTLAVADSYAYWKGSAIQRVPTGGGAIETLVDGRSLQSFLVLDDQLYYANFRNPPLGPAELWRQPINDPTSRELLIETSSQQALAANKADLFWRNGLYIAAMSRDGGTPRLVHSYLGFDAAPEAGFRVDDTNIYYQKKVGDQRSLYSLDLVRRFERRLTGPTTASPSFEADDQALYWVATQDGVAQLQRVPKDGSAVSTIATSPNHIGPLQSNGSTIVWQDWERHYDPDFGDDVFLGALVAAPAAGGDPMVITKCVGDGVSSLAVDATQLLWTNNCADCAESTVVLRVAPLP